MSSGVPIGAPFGLQMPTWDIRITNRTGSTRSKGDILKLDLDLGTEATDNNVGHALSGLANGEAAIAGAQCGVQVCCVCLEDIEDDKAGQARVYGMVDVASGGDVDPTGGSGEHRAHTTGSSYRLGSASAANDQGVYAIALASTGAAGVLTTVLWNGFTFGTMGT